MSREEWWKLIRRVASTGVSRRELTRYANLRDFDTHSSVIIDPISDGWYQSERNIQIPKALINTIAVETVKRAMKTELKHEIKNTSKMLMINMIFIPLALSLSLISLATSLTLISMGNWFLSIPFILSTIFGVYYFYLNRTRKI